MMPILHLRLLGDFSLAYGEEPVVSIATARLRSLLAYLVLHREAPQLRQHLAFLFWPDSPESQARTNLRQLLHELRQALPDADRYLVADTSTVRWRTEAPFQLDVAAFEHTLAVAATTTRADDQRTALEQAAHLYRADLLPSCYDDWIVPERERLRQQHRHALTQLIRLLEQRRDYADAIRYAQRLLQDDPLDEVVTRDLMRLLALNNDRAGALRLFHSSATRLQRELGVAPSQPTRDVYERLLQLDAPEAPELNGLSPRAAELRLVGRQREWQQLQAAWRESHAGGPGFALISGEAGIGKSRLAEELLTWATRQGGSAARTRCYAAEGQLSLAPVTDWLRNSVLFPQLAQLDPVWRTEAARILPELLAAQPGLPPPEPLSEYGQRQRFFEALARAVLAAPQPLLLVIDDLQWCDQETVEWVHFLLRFDPRARLMIVGTARAEEVPPHHPLRTLLLHLRRTIPVTELTLAPLDAAETARLATQITGHELDVDAAMWLYRETEGNPLFVVETVRGGLGAQPSAPAEDGWGLGSTPATALDTSPLPPRVHAVIASRLAQLSAPAGALVALAAAIGRGFTLDLLREAGQVDEAHAAGVLDELWQKRIVREQGVNRYDFTHDKLREVAYAELSAPQRRLLHHRIARALEATAADAPAPISGEIAAQYERAGMAQPAIEHYQRAAVATQRLYANEDAIALLVRGLLLLEQLPPGAQRDAQELTLQLALAPLYRMTKGWTSPEVERLLTRALTLCDLVGDDMQRAQVCYGLQSLYVVQARLEHVQLVSEDLQRLYQRTHGTPPPLVAGIMLTGSRLHLGQISAASAEFAQMIATHDPTQIQRIMEEQGWNYAVHARAWHAHGLWLLGAPEAALRTALDAVRLAHELDQPFNQVLAAAYLALLYQLCADEATAGAQATQTLALAAEFKVPYYRAWMDILVCYAQACALPDDANIADLRASIAAFTVTGARLRLPYFFGLLAQVCGRAGRTDEALAAVNAGMAEARAHNERWWDAELQRLRGDLLLAGGAATAEVEAAYRRALTIARAQQTRMLELRAATSLALLLRTQPHADDATRLLGACYASFTEGFATPDLQSARALLAPR
ncbi:MAG: AAA family ATPase [Chloroflexales bacterium]|nr:AAA family ATPase [Chloroflexales bacterium]